MFKNISKTSILFLCISICLVGCKFNPSFANHQTPTIEEIIEGEYTISYTSIDATDFSLSTEETLGALVLENGAYEFIPNSATQEDLPDYVYSQIPMLNNSTGKYTLSIENEVNGLSLDKLIFEDSHLSIGNIVFTSPDENHTRTYTIYIDLTDNDTYIRINPWESMLYTWGISKEIP